MIWNIVTRIQNCFNIVLDKKNGLFDLSYLNLIINELMVDFRAVNKHDQNCR